MGINALVESAPDDNHLPESVVASPTRLSAASDHAVVLEPATAGLDTHVPVSLNRGDLVRLLFLVVQNPHGDCSWHFCSTGGGHR